LTLICQTFLKNFLKIILKKIEIERNIEIIGEAVKRLINYKNENYTIFKTTADIYTLFIERGVQILKQNGRLNYITSNKWLRANYGEKLRSFLLKNTSIEKIIDFDGLKVFDEATVDTGIIEIKKFKNGNQQVEVVRFDKTFDLQKDNVAEYFKNNKIQLKNLTNNSWNLKSEKENAIKTKIEQKGKALENWNINIYRGITTGLNEAFVIDEKIKNELIKADKKNEQFIKPLLRGRDIKKYSVKSDKLWLIVIPKGYTIKSVLKNKNQSSENNNITVQEPRYGYISKTVAWNYMKENHNSIANYLKKFEQKAEKRDDKGDFWWELRACTYYSEFEKEKIIFTKASQTIAFAYDTNGHYLQNTSYILTGEKLKYLIGLLNSKLINFAFINFYQSGGIEGEITVQAINKIPIPEITEDNQETVAKIKTLVNEIINLKETDKEADISAKQNEIDKLVYQLYDLTNEEIEMIENAK